MNENNKPDSVPREGDSICVLWRTFGGAAVYDGMYNLRYYKWRTRAKRWVATLNLHIDKNKTSYTEWVMWCQLSVGMPVYEIKERYASQVHIMYNIGRYKLKKMFKRIC